jgi:malate synthase
MRLLVTVCYYDRSVFLKMLKFRAAMALDFESNIAFVAAQDLILATQSSQTAVSEGAVTRGTCNVKRQTGSRL